MTCGALSYAMEASGPPGQLAVKKKNSRLNELPLDIFHCFLEFLNVTDFLHHANQYLFL